jgi:hypothetical protein
MTDACKSNFHALAITTQRCGYLRLIEKAFHRVIKTGRIKAGRLSIIAADIYINLTGEKCRDAAYVHTGGDARIVYGLACFVLKRAVVRLVIP